MASEADKKKLIIVVVLFVLTGVVVAWNFELFGGSKPTPTTNAPPEAGQPRGGGARTAK